MVSNEELSKEIRDILKDADLEKLSRKMVRKQLEGKFHIDLGERKKFINETISQVFQEQQEEEEEEEEVVENEEEEDDEEDEVEEEEVKPQSSKRKASSSSKKKSSTSSSKRKRSESSKSSVSNNGFNAALLLSPELAQVLGKKELPRPQIVKAMWEYIHEHNLQDPKDKRSIILDERLRQVFQRDTFTMFSMNKYIKRHVCKPNELPSGGWDMIPRNGESSEEEDDTTTTTASSKKKKNKSKSKTKQKKTSNRSHSGGSSSGINAPQILSEELASFVGEKTLSRTQVVKKIWEYIRQKELQNPVNKKEILCDETLTSLFGEPQVTMFSMNKLIGKHFLGKAITVQVVTKTKE